ncbi:right-handed parallel beta-helix repeat-containing protein [Borrelia sp. RT5S]|uniref:right-handed parallel beta-helix repeat-containing protein n=1 Tax=Borrelia sp. RT5S TaxID=2898581 RepID=UPI001E5361BD|nr:right-handed parallel beta-helix repeat-containing protein [Borrelia sp. RT5S]UGQ16709.1 right-handed parallel beta-helix repeat-containing protein [Borrelia sp. RT5S]
MPEEEVAAQPEVVEAEAAQPEVIDQEAVDERTREDSTRVGGAAGVPLEVPEAPDELNPDELEEEELSCGEDELDIVFFTDEGQLFDLTPYTDITSVTLEQRIVDPTLKTASSVFKFAAAGLSNEFLNFLFFRQDDIFVVVKEGSSPLFAGILEKFFTREVLEATASISFTVNDYSKLLRISFENPVQFPVNFAPDWLYVYNPYTQDQSIVHLILAKTKLANSVDNEASEAILERVPAVIIDSGEDVETILSALLYEFGYAYTFTGAGKLVILPIWRSEVVKREVQLCSIDAASYVCSKSSASSYDSNRIIWRQGQFQAKSEAIAKKRPLYSAPINVAGTGGGMYVGVLQKGVVYPDFADKAGSAVYQEYDPTWFDTAYKWDFTRHEVWHDKYALNENLAIISTHNLEARFSADSSIKLVHEEYFPTKAKLWFVNESTSQGSKYIYYFDIYGDVFYTTVRNIMQTDNADDFYAKRAEYATRFIFDPDSAVRLFDFLTNLRVKGHTIVNFKSKQELQLTDFVRLKLEDEELDHFFLILSKKYVRFDMQTRFFEYEGLTWGDYSHYDYLTTSKHIGAVDSKLFLREVIVAPFNHDQYKQDDVYEDDFFEEQQENTRPHFKATGFKDEETIKLAIQLAKREGVNKIRLLAGDFYFYTPLLLDNLELKGDSKTTVYTGGFATNVFSAQKAFKMTGFSVCQSRMSELLISGGKLAEYPQPEAVYEVVDAVGAVVEDAVEAAAVNAQDAVEAVDVALLDQCDEYLLGNRFAEAASLSLCSVYGLVEEKRASIYATNASFVYLKDMKFSCNLGTALQTEGVEKILLEDAQFRGTAAAWRVSGVRNMNIMDTQVSSSTRAATASGDNILIRNSDFNGNKNAVKLSKFSSVRVQGSQFSNNSGTALQLEHVSRARLTDNIFTSNDVGLASTQTQDLLTRDIHEKNKIAFVKETKQGVLSRVVDANTYKENTIDTQEREVA